MSEEKEKTLGAAVKDFEAFSKRAPKKWFGTTVMFVLLCAVFGSAIVYTTLMWKGMTNRFGEMCEKFCTACGYSGYEASAGGSCKCYEDQTLGWTDRNAPNGFYILAKNISGCPNANATKGMKQFG